MHATQILVGHFSSFGDQRFSESSKLALFIQKGWSDRNVHGLLLKTSRKNDVCIVSLLAFIKSDHIPRQVMGDDCINSLDWASLDLSQPSWVSPSSSASHTTSLADDRIVDSSAAERGTVPPGDTHTPRWGQSEGEGHRRNVCQWQSNSKVMGFNFPKCYGYRMHVILWDIPYPLV